MLSRNDLICENKLDYHIKILLNPLVILPTKPKKSCFKNLDTKPLHLNFQHKQNSRFSFLLLSHFHFLPVTLLQWIFDVM